MCFEVFQIVTSPLREVFLEAEKRVATQVWITFQRGNVMVTEQFRFAVLPHFTTYD